FDPLGSTSRLTDGAQAVTDSYLFKGFGESLLAAGPTTNPFQFVGKEGYYRDPDLTSSFVRARNVAPAIGRWTTIDPLANRPLKKGRSVNPYTYVLNRAIVASDPSGLQGKVNVGTSGAAITLPPAGTFVANVTIPACPCKEIDIVLGQALGAFSGAPCN